MSGLRRRGFLLGGVGAGAALGTGAYALFGRRGASAATPIAVRATPIGHLSKDDPAARRFGVLTFRAGLVLTSESRSFGGWSALWRSPDGRDLVAVSDRGQWLTARPASQNGTLSGLADAVIAPILGADGEPLGQGPAYDTESLAIADGTAYVGIERVHEIRRFAWDRDGVSARGEPIPLPDETKQLPANAGFEALAVAPPGHRLAGALVAIAEEARRGDDTPTRGWVVTGPERFAFDVARSRAFDVTDAAFLPSGDLLLLERHYSIGRGAECRIRHVPGGSLRADAVLDGPVLFEANNHFEIDNMEGLALHRDPATGETVLTLISDDNFSPLQRTLLLEFGLGA